MSAEEVLKVATDALRTDASIWQRNVRPMNAIVSELGNLHFGAFESTTLAGLKSAYTEIWYFVRDMCTEGGQQFEEAAKGLEALADRFEWHEAARTRQLDRLRQPR